ncbi:PIF1-like helicase [Medicago truncatula]|uniref:ATP-dependent DNA helicase n=1 Tax=Medicago truncatula TaxID=3880 RepID=G7JL89_MEDTR|nr:PIF1-like helicase [Medicago truncatula]
MKIIQFQGVIQEELSVQIPNEDIESIQMLNHDQMVAFNTIMHAIDHNHKHSQVFFVDGPDGTGKTFLYRALMATLRNRGKIGLATASSGITATLLSGGITAHSRFNLPYDVQPNSFCDIKKQKDLAKLFRVATAIIWDEAPMTNKYCLEALDRSLRDILDCDALFGGKVMIMGGDFRQVLPLIQKGSKAQLISACIIRSNLWANIKVLHLVQNMRSMNDPEFAQFLMRIGDSVEPTKLNAMVRIPHQIALPWEGEQSIQTLIDHIFPQLNLHGWDASYMVERAIITLTNDDVQKLNDIIINQFSGEEHNLLSFDEVEGDTHNLYQREFLNSIAQGSIPPHILKVKKGAPLMLLRNIDPRYGLCNGTRLLCRGLFKNMLDVKILTGSNAGKRAFLRKQFSVKLSFAITINKSQGRTIPNVRIYLPRHVFSHGQ